MIANIDYTKFLSRVEEVKKDILLVLGAASVGWVAKKIRFNKSIVSGNLINSIAYSTSEFQSTVSDTTGTSLEAADEDKVKIGTNVVYAPRVEFGFVGQDSLGRNYNQPAKSFLRAAIKEHEQDITKLIKKIKL